MSGDRVLFLARKKLEKNMYSNKNWLIILILPVFIIPVVIYIIKCPLGLPIKIFAYTALYIRPPRKLKSGFKINNTANQI